METIVNCNDFCIEYLRVVAHTDKKAHENQKKNAHTVLIYVKQNTTFFFKKKY